jgi:homoserine dehydrogenase
MAKKRKTPAQPGQDWNAPAAELLAELPTDRDELLATARGSSTAVLLETDLMGQVAVFSMNPTVEQTAYGVFADLVDIARSL